MTQLPPILTLPKAVPVLPARAPQANIPQTQAEREGLRVTVQRYVAAHRDRLVPPLVLDELRTIAEDLIARSGIDPKYVDYAGVLLNNEIWREQLAPVPFERRLLLLPKCLRVEDRCPAPFDDFGLLCKQCGLCSIQDLQEEAEKLGYAVLVAEGSALVMAMIQTGKIDAIVGVSCLSVLERAMPYMEAAAIPGIAIPLLQDDCKDTGVDVEWVWEVLHLTSDDRTRRLDLEALKEEVRGWFTAAALDEVMGPPAGHAEEIAREWLLADGKRWRPFLTVCAYKAFAEDPEAPLPSGLRQAAVAVECFHKASLIHDDIEDNDAERYGKQAVHTEHGVPVALNAGDLLLGEGYRLLAAMDAPADIRADAVRIAADGQRQLCLGQGAELAWFRDPGPMTMEQVLQIFSRKTAPAFEVALQIGRIYAGADGRYAAPLRKFSEALGIAYQIRDDLDDLVAAGGTSDIEAMRPTLPMAIARQRTKGEEGEAVQRYWLRQSSGADASAIAHALEDSKAEERCRGLLESYKEEAVRSLTALDHSSIKGLLRRVVGKIFNVEIKGWCSEFETRNAASGAVGAETPR
ncbi:MAG TPA: polyprenyl synthetase family protein [Bryobacteraceae bacterium]|nr:polyprenyl synthetase family protein [Bryobacteraceae bacterium]